MIDKTEWTIEKELQKITDTKSMLEALRYLRIISDEVDSYSLRQDIEWKRGGAETYIFKFWISTNDEGEKGYIIKACVSLDLQRGIEGVLADWLKRREILKKHGVVTPQLFYSGNGIVIEEFIPWSLREYLQKNTDKVNKLLPLIVDYTAVLARFGFAPVDGFSDLRTHGDDVIPVDFGQDIGNPRIVEGVHLQLFNVLAQTIWHWGVLPSRDLSPDLYQRFLKSINQQ